MKRYLKNLNQRNKFFKKIFKESEFKFLLKNSVTKRLKINICLI